MKFAIRDGWRIQIRSVLVVVLLYFTVRVWRVVNRVAECQSYEYHEFPMLLAERKRKQKRKEKLPWIMDDHGWPEADRSGRQAHQRACPDPGQARRCEVRPPAPRRGGGPPGGRAATAAAPAKLH